MCHAGSRRKENMTREKVQESDFYDDSKHVRAAISGHGPDGEHCGAILCAVPCSALLRLRENFLRALRGMYHDLRQFIRLINNFTQLWTRDCYHTKCCSVG